MQLIYAKITGQPRNVTTRQGDRSVVDARAANGESLTIWRPANDPAVMGLANGERVQLAFAKRRLCRIGSNGKVSLVETAQTRAEEAAAKPMGFAIKLTEPPAESKRSIEIADYIERLGKLYRHCYKTAAKELEETPLATPEVKDVATTIFIQTIRHFGL